MDFKCDELILGKKDADSRALTPFWQGVSQVNPIIYMVNAFRYGFLGISDVPLGTAYLIIIGFIVALYGLAWWLISRGTGLRH